MRYSYLAVCFVLLLSCGPGRALVPFQPKDKASNASAQPLGRDAVPVPAGGDARTPPPDDPLEEEKAVEPAIIGGAYLFCDAEEDKPGAEPLLTLNVGCRVENVADTEWMAAEKDLFVMNNLSDVLAASPVSIMPEGSAYHMMFATERSLKNHVELHMDVMLPQGRLVMSTTVSPEPLKINPQSGKGLTLHASTGTTGNWPGVDRKTWNRWLPVEIPHFVTRLNPDPSNQGPGRGEEGEEPNQVELVYDETVCLYETVSPEARDDNEAIKGAKPEDFIFKSCTRNWQPAQWVRVKSLSLRLKTDGTAAYRSAAAFLRTEP